jgi:hypothetical protein
MDGGTATVVAAAITGAFGLMVVLAQRSFRSENTRQHAENRATAEAVLAEVKGTRADVGRLDNRVTGIEGSMRQHLLQHVEGRYREEHV